MLYGENEFVVAMSEAVSDDLHFFNRIGDATKFIRTLTLFRGSPIVPKIRDAVFAKLGEMPMLHSLTWFHDGSLKEGHAAKLLLPCMKAVQKRLDESSQSNEKRSALEILHTSIHTGISVPPSLLPLSVMAGEGDEAEATASPDAMEPELRKLMKGKTK